MGLTAREAFKISEGSIKHKSIFFKIKLIFICGMIDQEIRNAANIGRTEITVYKLNDRDFKRYMPFIWNVYENLGYKLYRTNKRSTAVYINWDPNFDPEGTVERYHELVGLYTTDKHFQNFVQQYEIHN